MWNCKQCSEAIEDDLEICWNCGTSVDGEVDPDFVRADDFDPDLVRTDEVDPVRHTRRAFKKRAGGEGWALIGAAAYLTAIVFCGVLFLSLFVPPKEFSSDSTPLFVVRVVAGMAASVAWYFGKGFQARSRVLESSDRVSNPVLVLRSFADDVVDVNRGLLDSTTIEESIVPALAVFGQVIAIGRPGESLPASGGLGSMLRMSVGDQRWRVSSAVAGRSP